jgi:rhamnose utilization protein RhaD (predicted bifunctional aldolase and dehydrogenase)
MHALPKKQAYVMTNPLICATATDTPDIGVSGAPSALVAVSARIGSDLRLVQGGGGNTSLKRGDDFWVKASGTWLAEAESRDIFVRLPLKRVRTLMAGPQAESALAALAPDGGLRPSIETSLHALLPHAAVLHVHSVNTIVWAARDDGQAALDEALQGLSWAWVPYRRPGLPLTEAIADALARAPTPPDILILGNHGLVVGGEDCAAAEALLQTVEARLARPARAPLPADPARLRAANDLDWSACDSERLNAIATDDIIAAVAARGALYPDHVVFLGERALIVDEHYPLSRALADAATAGISPPPYAVVPGAGLLLSPELSAGARAMLECLAEVGLRIDDLSRLRYLNDADAAALLGWEAEAYRRARDTTPAHTQS